VPPCAAGGAKGIAVRVPSVEYPLKSIGYVVNANENHYQGVKYPDSINVESMT